MLEMPNKSGKHIILAAQSLSCQTKSLSTRGVSAFESKGDIDHWMCGNDLRASCCFIFTSKNRILSNSLVKGADFFLI